MLRLATGKADKLLTDLLAEQADLEKNPPKLPPAQLAQDRLAMENAIAAARRMAVALRDALRIAEQGPLGSSNDRERDT